MKHPDVHDVHSLWSGLIVRCFDTTYRLLFSAIVFYFTFFGNLMI